jgi:hypothetical protein
MMAPPLWLPTYGTNPMPRQTKGTNPHRPLFFIFHFYFFIPYLPARR